MSAVTPHAPRRQAAVVFIFFTVMLDMLGFGLVIPVLPHLLVQLVGGSIASAAAWSSAFGAVYMLMQFVFSPLLGSLSDRYGRRAVILISCLGLGLDYVLMAVTPSLWWLFVGRIISGICAASYSTGSAYIADVTPQEKRAAAYGMLGGAFAVGFIIGPALGGLLGHWSVRLPFWIAAALSLCNFIYGLLVLPESLPPERRSARFDWRRANPFGALLLLRRYRQVFALAGTYFLSNLAQFSLNATYVLYADYRYGWGPQAVGYTLGFVGLCSGLVQAGLVRRLMPKLGERKLILIGLPLCTIGYLIFGFSVTGWLFVLGIPFLCLGGLADPPAQALMSQQVDAQEQGRLQGALSSIRSVAGIIGPVVFANIFALFISNHAPVKVPGMAFVVAAALLVLATLIAQRATRRLPDARSDAALTPEPPPTADLALPAHERDATP